MYSILDILVLYSFLIFLEQVPEFLNFLTGLALVSYKKTYNTIYVNIHNTIIILYNNI